MTQTKPTEKIQKIKKLNKRVGFIVSDKMDKTRVVAIVEHRAHPIYQKTFSITNKIKVHDEKNEYHTGDKVEIIETKPYSKNKAWLIQRKLNNAPSK